PSGPPASSRTSAAGCRSDGDLWGGPWGCRTDPSCSSAPAADGYVRHSPDRRAWDDEAPRSEEHTSELQSRENLVCRLLPENERRRPHRSRHPPRRLGRAERPALRAAPRAPILLRTPGPPTPPDESCLHPTASTVTARLPCL